MIARRVSVEPDAPAHDPFREEPDARRVSDAPGSASDFAPAGDASRGELKARGSAPGDAVEQPRAAHRGHHEQHADAPLASRSIPTVSASPSPTNSLSRSERLVAQRLQGVAERHASSGHGAPRKGSPQRSVVVGKTLVERNASTPIETTPATRAAVAADTTGAGDSPGRGDGHVALKPADGTTHAKMRVATPVTGSRPLREVHPNLPARTAIACAIDTVYRQPARAIEAPRHDHVSTSANDTHRLVVHEAAYEPQRAFTAASGTTNGLPLALKAAASDCARVAASSGESKPAQIERPAHEPALTRPTQASAEPERTHIERSVEEQHRSQSADARTEGGRVPIEPPVDEPNRTQAAQARTESMRAPIERSVEGPGSTQAAHVRTQPGQTRIERSVQEPSRMRSAYARTEPVRALIERSTNEPDRLRVARLQTALSRAQLTPSAEVSNSARMSVAAATADPAHGAASGGEPNRAYVGSPRAGSHPAQAVVPAMQVRRSPFAATGGATHGAHATQPAKERVPLPGATSLGEANHEPPLAFHGASFDSASGEIARSPYPRGDTAWHDVTHPATLISPGKATQAAAPSPRFGERPLEIVMRRVIDAAGVSVPATGGGSEAVTPMPLPAPAVRTPRTDTSPEPLATSRERIVDRAPAEPRVTEPVTDISAHPAHSRAVAYPSPGFDMPEPGASRVLASTASVSLRGASESKPILDAPAVHAARSAADATMRMPASSSSAGIPPASGPQQALRDGVSLALAVRAKPAASMPDAARLASVLSVAARRIEPGARALAASAKASASAGAIDVMQPVTSRNVASDALTRDDHNPASPERFAMNAPVTVERGFNDPAADRERPLVNRASMHGEFGASNPAPTQAAPTQVPTHVAPTQLPTQAPASITEAPALSFTAVSRTRASRQSDPAMPGAQRLRAAQSAPVVRAFMPSQETQRPPSVLPLRHAVQNAHSVATSESTAIDRLADQYGVVPIDLQAAPPSGGAHAGAAPANTKASSAQNADPNAKPADAAQLAEEAWQIIMDKLAIERERRGFASWP